VAIVAPGAGDADARADVVEPRGSELLIYLRLGDDGSGGELRVVAPPERQIAVDAAVGVRLDRDRLHWFDEPTGRRLD
jgi:ABC-type sugar transport system ATPase subunit